jgi:hypothetical protein
MSSSKTLHVLHHAVKQPAERPENDNPVLLHGKVDRSERPNARTSERSNVPTPERATVATGLLNLFKM